MKDKEAELIAGATTPRRGKGKKSRVASVTLTDQQYEWLTAEAAREDRTITAQIHRMLRKVIEEAAGWGQAGDPPDSPGEAGG